MRHKSLYLLTIALVIGGVLVCRRPLPEPIYGGKKLSEWALIYYEEDSALTSFSGGPPEVKEEAAKAIRHIGTNAIPYLLEWMKYEQPFWITHLIAFKDKHLANVKMPAWVNEEIMLQRITAQNRPNSALAALQVLGPEAKAAIPKVARLINDPREKIHRRALSCLTVLGPEGYQPLLAAMTNRNPDVRYYAAVYASRIGTNARPAVPLLIQWLKEPDYKINICALWSLANLKLDSPLVVPSLVRSLDHTNVRVQLEAVNALEEYGTNALAAVPALLSLLNHPNGDFRYSVTSALQNISPQALTNVSPR